MEEPCEGSLLASASIFFMSGEINAQLPLFLGAVVFIAVSMTGCAAFHVSPDTLSPLSCGVLAPLLSIPQAAASVIIHSVVGIIMSRMSAQGEDPGVSSAHGAPLAVTTGAYAVALFQGWLAMRMMSGEEDECCSRAELFSMHALLCVGQVVIMCSGRRLKRHYDTVVLGEYERKTQVLKPDSRLINLVPPENQFCIDWSTFEQLFEKACLFLQNLGLEAVDREGSHERHQQHRQASLVNLDSQESASATWREHDDFFKPAASVQVSDAEIVVPASAIWKLEDFMNSTAGKLHRADRVLAACREQMEELEDLLRREETQGQEKEKLLEAFILQQQALGTVRVRASQKETLHVC